MLMDSNGPLPVLLKDRQCSELPSGYLADNRVFRHEPYSVRSGNIV